MDTLTLSLLLMAALAIVVVLAYNGWQQFRTGGKSNAPGHRGTRSEPRIDKEHNSEPSAPGPTLSPDAPSPTATVAQQELPPAPEPGPNELVDEIVEVALPAPVSGERLNAMLQGWRRVGSKPVSVEGRVQGQEEWSRVGSANVYEALRFAVLLANRRGALNPMEYSEFVVTLDKFGESVGVLIDTPDMAPVLQRARVLDAKLIELDALIGVNLVFERTLAPADLIAMAQASAMAERGSERWARLDDAGQVIFSLSLAEAPTTVSLLLDFPRVAVPMQPWQQMLACARKLCDEFGGKLLDDQGRVLSEATIQAISAQVLQRQEAMRLAGIEPGSPLALRVFN